MFLCFLKVRFLSPLSTLHRVVGKGRFRVYDEYLRKSPFRVGKCCSQSWTNPCLLQGVWPLAAALLYFTLFFSKAMGPFALKGSEAFSVCLCQFNNTDTLSVLFGLLLLFVWFSFFWWSTLRQWFMTFLAISLHCGFHNTPLFSFFFLLGY